MKLTIDQIKNHLAQDEKFAPNVENANLALVEPQAPDKFFERLVRSIAYQQLSGKAAGTIYGRFKQLFPQEDVTIEAVLATAHEDMRAAGLSNSKASYIRNIAQAVVDETIEFEQLPTMENEDIIVQLTQIKGVGRWTVEMFLMFTMGRPDIFSYGDLGLAKGINKIYGLDTKKDRAEVDKLLARWSPYKSYASLVLWDAVDTKNG
jgi:DNA-3-methyladenine glycosylase II